MGIVVISLTNTMISEMSLPRLRSRSFSEGTMAAALATAKLAVRAKEGEKRMTLAGERDKRSEDKDEKGIPVLVNRAYLCLLRNRTTIFRS